MSGRVPTLARSYIPSSPAQTFPSTSANAILMVPRIYSFNRNITASAMQMRPKSFSQVPFLTSAFPSLLGCYHGVVLLPVLWQVPIKSFSSLFAHSFGFPMSQGHARNKGIIKSWHHLRTVSQQVSAVLWVKSFCTHKYLLLENRMLQPVPDCQLPSHFLCFF